MKAHRRQMSIFKPKACHLFISPLILNYGGTKLGRVWGTGQKSCVIFFCWCEIHIFGIAVISVLPLFGRDFWIFASMVLTRPFLLGASDCIWKKKGRNVSGSSVGCFECFWFSVWTRNQCHQLRPC